MVDPYRPVQDIWVF